MRDELFKVKNYSRMLVNNYNASMDESSINPLLGNTTVSPDEKKKNVLPDRSTNTHALYQDIFIIDLKDEIKHLKRQLKLEF
jgi:hypothetical protein